MKLFTEVGAMVNYMIEMRLKGKSVGFVPTMGALHQGHVALINNSAKENDITVCSIFVNPTQFNNQEDLQKYPRNTQKDLDLLSEHHCDLVFIPEAQTMYKDHRILNFDFGYLEEIMEGKFRPNHFKGVGLVVCKFFNMIMPHRAYFGTKDLQQLVIVQKLVEELNMNVEIRPVETVRNKNGLALSSRNERLSDKELEEACILNKLLREAKDLLLENKTAKETRKIILGRCNNSNVFDVEYFEIVNRKTLLPVEKIKDNEPVSACIAGFIGKVRLIDNISIN